MRHASNKPRMPYKPTPDGHGIAALTGGRINAVSKTVVSPKGPAPCLSNTTVVSNANAIDMTMDVTENHMQMMVRDCVKKELFCHLKFYKKEFHGNYDFRKESVCALVIQCCNLDHEEATLKWWNTEYNSTSDCANTYRSSQQCHKYHTCTILWYVFDNDCCLFERMQCLTILLF
jgi:hypothetical protein